MSDKHSSLIIGYGYCGYYLAKTLLRKDDKQRVTAWSRQSSKYKIEDDRFEHYCVDLEQLNSSVTGTFNTLYYCAAPSINGCSDSRLQNFLHHNNLNIKQIVYFSSSGVYGDHQGGLVTEESRLNLVYERQYRRQDAEKQWTEFCHKKNINGLILRIAGMYGPGRIPLDAAKSNHPLIESGEAPLVNMIYIEDLIKIVLALRSRLDGVQVFNLSDGVSRRCGASQRELMALLKIAPTVTQSFSRYYQEASQIRREFLSSSKYLSIEKLKSYLDYPFVSLTEGLQQSLLLAGD